MSLSAPRNPTRKKSVANPRKQLLSRRLAAAAGDGDLVGIGKQLELGADINYRNVRGETPLTFAAVWDQFDAAKLLLNRGADPNLPDKTGGTALMLAAQHGSPKLVKLLLKYGADAHAKDKAGNTVLAHADWRQANDADKVRESLRKAGNAKHRAIA